MKIFRWIAIVLVSFFVIGAMGVITYKVYAQGSLVCDDDPSSPALQSQAGLTREQAETIARDQYSGSNALETELERECGILLYEVELDNAVEVEVDANAGTVLLTETGSSSTDNVNATSNVTAPAKTAITADEAKRIAEEANPGATALEIDFENEGGIDMWEVELSNNLEVELDANSGAILSTEQD